MANFDAMVPLIPRDVRIPIAHDNEQQRINQVERAKEIEKISEEEGSTITDNDSRRQQPQQQNPQSGQDGNGADEGHIDTYA